MEGGIWSVWQTLGKALLKATGEPLQLFPPRNMFYKIQQFDNIVYALTMSLIKK